MAKARTVTSSAVADVRGFRKALGVDQKRFWPVFGISQSGGSRFENLRKVSRPVALLLVLLEQGKVSAEDLVQAGVVVDATQSTKKRKPG